MQAGTSTWKYAEMTNKSKITPLYSLSLEIIHIAPVNHVAGVDEELCPPHGLDEVGWSAHLGHELNEELGATICVHTLHQPVNRANKTGRIGKPIVVYDGRVRSGRGIWGNGGCVDGSARASEDGNGVVGRGVGNDACLN